MHQLRPIDGRCSITFVYDTIQVDNARSVIRRRAALAYLRLVARASRFVLTPSQWSRSELIRQRVDGSDKFVLIAPALDSDFVGLIRRAREESPAQSQEQLLCVAGSAPHKGVETLAVAYERSAFRQRGGLLTIVGRRPAGTPMPDGIRWLEQPLPDPELARLYASSACIITPSRAEGFGLPPQEALAAGLPAIVSCGSALAEIDHPNARHFDLMSPDSLTTEIDRMTAGVAAAIPSSATLPFHGPAEEEAFAGQVVRVVRRALAA